MIKKLLIANRGEIAVRIVRACAEMGIKSVAVYAEADRYALHVKKADEAYSLGPDTVAGYLNAHHLVNIAVAAGCDAVHPGYGFLSENPELAETCKRRGIYFVGPEAETIRKLGDKTIARQMMLAAGIPVTPGSNDNVVDLNDVKNIASDKQSQNITKTINEFAHMAGAESVAEFVCDIEVFDKVCALGVD